MKYFVRKMYFSIFVCLFILITVVTTTFAWYSTNQNVIIDDFYIGISGKNGDSSSLRGVEMSIDGINFKEEIGEVDCKRAVLLAKGYNALNMDDHTVRNLFSKLKFTAVTPKNYNNLTEGFEVVNKYLDTYSSTDFIFFDLYVSATEFSSQAKDEKMELYFQNDEMAVAQDVATVLPIKLKDHPILGEIPRNINVNAKNACRIGYVLYDTIEKGKPQESEQIDSKIYSLSSNTPSVDKGVYNFGGIHTEYNAMLEYYNEIMSVNYSPLVIPDKIKDREDEEIYSKKIFGEEANCNSNSMVKIRFYIWMEGWDSDCFDAILHSTISFSIKLSSSIA